MNNNLSWFTQTAKGVSRIAGRPDTFMVAIALILLWALSGPFFDFSDTGQLVIHTGTTITTFLMVFLIQNTQNRHKKALPIKLDERLRALRTACNTRIDLEDLDGEEREAIRRDHLRLA